MTSSEVQFGDHNTLFESVHYQEQFERKREFEAGCGSDEVETVKAWTRSPEYREKNFARGALTVNPAKAGVLRELPLVQEY